MASVTILPQFNITANHTEVYMKNNLTQKELKELLHYSPDTGVFVRIKIIANSHDKIGDVAGGYDCKGYRVIRVKGKPYKAHRLAWLYMTGEWPASFIDHKNRIRDDNRLCNLREASPKENNLNSKMNKNNTSGYKGVRFCRIKDKWQALIKINSKVKNLGYFHSPNAAAYIYLFATIKYHNGFTGDLFGEGEK